MAPQSLWLHCHLSIGLLTQCKPHPTTWSSLSSHSSSHLCLLTWPLQLSPRHLLFIAPYSASWTHSYEWYVIALVPSATTFGLYRTPDPSGFSVPHANSAHAWTNPSHVTSVLIVQRSSLALLEHLHDPPESYLTTSCSILLPLLTPVSTSIHSAPNHPLGSPSASSTWTQSPISQYVSPWSLLVICPWS